MAGWVWEWTGAGTRRWWKRWWWSGERRVWEFGVNWFDVVLASELIVQMDVRG